MLFNPVMSSTRPKPLNFASQPVSLLGVQAGRQFWLLKHADVLETVPVPALHPLPFVRPWMRGVAAAREGCYSVTDLSLFHGGPSVILNAASRLVLLSPRHGDHCSLLVNRVLGLCSTRHFRVDPTPNTPPPWVSQCYLDQQEQRWWLLDIQRLTTSETFLQTEAVVSPSDR